MKADNSPNRPQWYLFDYIILGYLALLTAMILIFGRPLINYADELLQNFIFAVIVFSAILLLRKTDIKIVKLFRLLYPVLLFTFFYRQTQGIIFLIFPDFLDFQITAFERAVLGVNLTFWIEQNILNVWLTEILSFFYAAYYPMIPVFFIWIFLKGDYEIIKKSLTAICLTFFISYLLFFLYPIEGPRYHFSGMYQHQIEGPIFRQFVEFVQQTGSVHGGCMPSSHVGVALVINIFCLKYYRRAGWLLLIVNTGMALGTFYGRYHYISDVIVGAVIGISMTWLTMRYYEHFQPDSGITERTKMEKIESVSRSN